MIWLVTNWRAVAGAAAGALVTAAAFAVLVLPVDRRLSEARGRAAYQTEIALAAAKAEKERVADDARLSNLSDRDLCERSLRSRGMPIGACSGL